MVITLSYFGRTKGEKCKRLRGFNWLVLLVVLNGDSARFLMDLTS